MKMITLFLPEKYLEMLDTLVSENLYPNRSEALRIATFKFLHESVDMLKACQPAESAKTNEPSLIDTIINDIDATKEPSRSSSSKQGKTSTLEPVKNVDPFEELTSSIQVI